MKTTRTAALVLGLIAASFIPRALEAQIIILTNPLVTVLTWYRVNYSINSVVQVNDATLSNIQVTVVYSWGSQFVVTIPAYVPAPGTIDLMGHVAPMTGELMARMCKEYQFRQASFKPLNLLQFRSWGSGTVNADTSSQVRLCFANPQGPRFDGGVMGGLIDVLVTNSTAYFAEINMLRYNGRVQQCKLLRKATSINGMT